MKFEVKNPATCNMMTLDENQFMKWAKRRVEKTIRVLKEKNSVQELRKTSELLKQLKAPKVLVDRELRLKRYAESIENGYVEKVRAEELRRLIGEHVKV